MTPHLRTVLIIPAYNEAGKIGLVIQRAKPFVNRIVVVDDGSTDATAKEASAHKVVVIQKHENQGVGAALRTGFTYAHTHGFPVCLVMGGDDQDNPEEIPRLLSKINQGHDLVQGSRYLHHEQTENMPLFRRITTKAHSLLFRIVTGFPITDATNGFRAIRTVILTSMYLNQRWLDHYELEPYLLYQAITKGYHVTEVQVTKRYPKNRAKGFSKMRPFIDWWSITRPLLLLILRLKK